MPAVPLYVVDSMCSMLCTRVVRPFSKGVVSRVSRSSGFSPVYVHATDMTGMSTFGKMSVGVRRMTAGLSKRMRMARTTNVYGRLRASLTIHISSPWLGYAVHRKIRCANSYECLLRLSDTERRSPCLTCCLSSCSMRSETVRSHLYYAARGFETTKAAWRSLDHLVRWARRVEVARLNHTLLSVVTILRKHGAPAHNLCD